MPELSRHIMHKPGTSQWDVLPSKVAEPGVPIVLMQLVYPASVLPHLRGKARDFRAEYAETPGMDLSRIWDVRIDHHLNPPGPFALHIFAMTLPASLMETSIRAYLQDWSVTP
ncbi:MAG: hypothetical protein E5V37_07670 [Mesorhizobium sp.]|nr:MAG: hypothetical protein E5V37_07670 [Mesorhizobium sp.]